MTFTFNSLAQNSSIVPKHPKVTEADMQQAVRTLLIGLGENPDREGLLDTPKRVVKALKFLTSGYNKSLDELLHGPFFMKIRMKWSWFEILTYSVPASTIFCQF